jgi:hypothetical protein
LDPLMLLDLSAKLSHGEPLLSTSRKQACVSLWAAPLSFMAAMRESSTIATLSFQKFFLLPIADYSWHLPKYLAARTPSTMVRKFTG